jgi:hypothetical protein
LFETLSVSALRDTVSSLLAKPPLQPVAPVVFSKTWASGPWQLVG